LTTQEQEQLKNQIIIDLCNSKIIEDKLPGIFRRHLLPKEADLQNDCLQTMYLHLVQYDTTKFINIWKENPKKIIGLGITILLRKGVFFDTRRKDTGHNSSIARQILYSSNLTSWNTSLSDENESFDQLLFTNHEVATQIDAEEEASAEDKIRYARSFLNQNENTLLDSILLPNKKRKGRLYNHEKTQIENLKNKIKEIIEKKWNNRND